LGVILAVCFAVGLMVKTRVGQFIQEKLEKRILQLAPGYPTIKAVIIQLIGKKMSPFSSVVLVRPSENDTLLAAFIPSEAVMEIWSAKDLDIFS
jgi:uncharacterized membrane protein